MRLFWDRSESNFGDMLGPYIIERLTGQAVEWAPPEGAEAFAIGSIAEAIPPGFTGIVLGTGKMFAATGLDLRRARVIALRGPLTAEGSRASCQLFADLGLLASDFAPQIEPDIAVGHLPHYVDDRTFEGTLRIDVRRPVEEVIATAARCRQIVASSLHGLVLADALGIPSMWDPHPAVLGDGFKFRDYAAGYGETIEPYRARLADRSIVAAKQEYLRKAVTTLAKVPVA